MSPSLKINCRRKEILPQILCLTYPNLFFFFLLDFDLSRLTSLQFIHYHLAGFYKPTIPQSPPSHLWDYSTCNNARLEFSTIFVPSFDPNEWSVKNGLHSGGLNPGPRSHESSALSTRPRLLAYKVFFSAGRMIKKKLGNSFSAEPPKTKNLRKCFVRLRQMAHN